MAAGNRESVDLLASIVNVVEFGQCVEIEGGQLTDDWDFCVGQRLHERNCSRLRHRLSKIVAVLGGQCFRFDGKNARFGQKYLKQKRHQIQIAQNVRRQDPDEHQQFDVVHMHTVVEHQIRAEQLAESPQQNEAPDEIICDERRCHRDERLQ